MSSTTFTSLNSSREYLNERLAPRVLTKVEERLLLSDVAGAKCVRAALVSEGRLATKEDNVVLDKARRSRDELVNNNLPLVFYAIQRYSKYFHDSDDSISSGIEGLLKAIDSFDLNIDVRFGTHALWCIRTALQGTLAKTGMRAVHRASNTQEVIYSTSIDEVTVATPNLVTAADNTELQAILACELDNLEVAIANLPAPNRAIIEMRLGRGVNIPGSPRKLSNYYKQSLVMLKHPCFTKGIDEGFTLKVGHNSDVRTELKGITQA